jgi:hypothetical protein
MKTAFILLFSATLISNAQFLFLSPPRQPVTWKGAQDESLGFSTAAFAEPNPDNQIVEQASVACEMQDTNEQADFLRFNSMRLYFNRGEPISQSRPINPDVFVGGNRHNALVLAYDWRRESFSETNTVANYDFTLGKTEVYVGFRDYRASQPHYGWAHLRRDSTNAGVAYVMVDWAVNPFPDQPIRAGESPDLPPLSTVVDTATDPANPTLRVSWPAGFPGVKLQTTGDLTPPVQWLDQELSAERLAVLALPPEGTLFFRLVWAGP